MSAAGGAIKEFVGRFIGDKEMMDRGHMERTGHAGHPMTDGERVQARLGDSLDQSRRAHARRSFKRGRL
jgi:hypothetical protein